MGYETWKCVRQIALFLPTTSVPVLKSNLENGDEKEENVSNSPELLEQILWQEIPPGILQKVDVTI